MNRRNVIRTITYSTGGVILANALPVFAKVKQSGQVACQHYTCNTFMKREGIDFSAADPAHLEKLKEAGYTGFEPSFNSVEQVVEVGKALKKAGMWISSFYVNSALHEPELASESITTALAIARAAKDIGAKIVVTNPVPIQWGGDETKTDEQLVLQARKLDELGGSLRDMDMSLAYHTHDAEMKRGAREFHHMLVNTHPDNVKLCLDSHWVFRGTGDSEVAIFDVVKLYGDRIVELHLRQSTDGIWSETFGPGDIDHQRLMEELKKQKIQPHLVCEQAVEQGTPDTMDTVAALSRSLDYLERVFVG